MINGRCRSAGTHEEAWSLPGGVTAGAIASACREAGLQFLEGVAGDWGKADLALWLAGPYRDATRFGAPIRGSTPPPPEPRMSAPGGLGAQIDRIVRETRWHVLASLEGLALPDGRHRFVDRALAASQIVARKDSEGCAVWVPVDVPGMRLTARVESLFAADYLTRPSDYGTDLFVCHRCECVVFDREARRRGDCGGHVSGRFAYAAEPASPRSSQPPTPRTTLQWRN